MVSYVFFNFKIMRILGKQFGFEAEDKPTTACAGDERTTLIWSMKKDL